MPPQYPIIVGDDGKKYYDVPGSTRKFPVDVVDGTSAPLIEPGAEIPRAKWLSMSDTERNAAFQQSKARSAEAVKNNPKGAYGGQLADVSGFKIDPEDVIGMGAAIGPNLVKRGSAAVDTLKESGNLFKAAGAGLKSPEGGIVSRLMKLLSGEGGSAAETAADVVPSAINPTGATGTKFGWLDRSPLPPKMGFTPKVPRNMSADRTDDLLGTLERIMQGGVKVKGSATGAPIPVNPSVPANMTQTRTDDLVGTIQRILRGVRP